MTLPIDPNDKDREIARLTKALRDIVAVPWFSSGRDVKTVDEQHCIALGEKDRIADEALAQQPPDETA